MTTKMQQLTPDQQHDITLLEAQLERELAKLHSRHDLTIEQAAEEVTRLAEQYKAAADTITPYKNKVNIQTRPESLSVYVICKFYPADEVYQPAKIKPLYRRVMQSEMN